MKSRRPKQRVEFGDWQTPFDLCCQVTELALATGFRPASILEPTCGRGAFLEAATRHFSDARAWGFDINRAYVEEARRRIPRAHIEVGDFFQLPWEAIIGKLPEPIFVIGNPPWVTNSSIGAIGAQNLPAKSNIKSLTGLDAKTGKANFDVAEWMLSRLVDVLRNRRFFMAMLCKASVARRLMQHAYQQGWNLDGATYGIDARAFFGAAVDAVLLTISTIGPAKTSFPHWPAYERLTSKRPTRRMGIVDGHVSSNVEQFKATRSLQGQCSPEWRSGVKHDCARVMELLRSGGATINGFGERVDVEDEFVFPLLKGSDISNGRAPGQRFVLVPQRKLGEDTAALQVRAPRTWAYLQAHRKLLDARKSSIYRGKPSFSVFGIGDYSFSPYKVAICGLYKRLEFKLVEPHDGRPVMVDDTCYFLPCKARDDATAIATALNGEQAKRFFQARVFWSEKRPISKALLQTLSIEALLRG